MYYFITSFVKDRGFGDFSAGLVALDSKLPIQGPWSGN